MNRLFVVLVLTGIAQISAWTAAPAQEVLETSYTAANGEKVLRFEVVVPASRAEVWKAFSTSEGARGWMAPRAAMDLRVGGELVTRYDTTAALDDPGSIHLPILNYLDEELITFKVELTESFPPSTQSEDQNLQEIVQLRDEGEGKTRVVSSMVGWGTGPDWEKTYGFFRKGNEWTYRQLVRYLGGKAK